jgi:hypothetical protein
MANCIGCGKGLNQGNSKRVLVPGTKKRRLVCRRFPECRPARTSKRNRTAVEADSRNQNRGVDGVGNNLVTRQDAKTAGVPAVMVLDNLDAAVKGKNEDKVYQVEGILDFPTRGQVLFFIRPAVADKIRKAMDQGISSPSIMIEVLRVPAAIYETNPERYSELIPVEINMKVEG